MSKDYLERSKPTPKFPGNQYTKRPIEVKFWERVSKTPTERGCLEWAGSRNPKTGYGTLYHEGKEQHSSNRQATSPDGISHQARIKTS